MEVYRTLLALAWHGMAHVGLLSSLVLDASGWRKDWYLFTFNKCSCSGQLGRHTDRRGALPSSVFVQGGQTIHEVMKGEERFSVELIDCKKMRMNLSTFRTYPALI